MPIQQVRDHAKTDTQQASAPALMLTPREAANVAGVSPRTITRLCESGQIKAAKLGGSWRVNRAAFMAQLGITQ